MFVEPFKSEGLRNGKVVSVVLGSKVIEKLKKNTRNEWRRWNITLETSGEGGTLHSKRVEKMYT
jgi:hypothetical protein